MKKLFLLMALFAAAPTLAHEPDHHREHREWHERGGNFGWGEFVGGLVLGGIIAHEINGHYYNRDEREVRRVTVCNDYPVVDQWGHYVYDQWGHMIIERRCHDEWVRVDR